MLRTTGRSVSCGLALMRIADPGKTSLLAAASRVRGARLQRSASSLCRYRGLTQNGVATEHAYLCQQIHIRCLASDAKIEENVRKIKEGDYGKVSDPEDFKHFRTRIIENEEAGIKREKLKEEPEIGVITLPHPIWSKEEINNVHIVHKKPKGFVDWAAYITVQTLRVNFDIFSGFLFGKRNEGKWLLRLIFLETVAGVPGMVAAMVRHLHSLRRMRRDHGWIHTLLEEAENERMHLMTAIQLKQPGPLLRFGVVLAQGIYVSLFSVAYLVSPRFCHRLVGYLEEEAVITYSKCIKDMDEGPLNHWNSQPAPNIAVNYWHLAPDATMRDVIYAIRADENHHREVNHTLASMKPDDYNPYKPGQ